MKKITYHKFNKEFKCVKNQLNKNSAFNGTMFETFGCELEFVKGMIQSNKVITILDCDGTIYLNTGYAVVNRIGYLILENPYTFEFSVKVN